jgi:hypothetical protein
MSKSAAVAASNDLSSVLATASSKDRTSIEKHLAACDAEGSPEHGELLRRLLLTLGTLAPHALATMGQGAVQFFIPDGKYRKQVFALEDQRDGTVNVYLPNVLAQAIRAKVLKAGPEPGSFAIVENRQQQLQIEELDAANTPNPPTCAKHMLGWNRKALRVTVPVSAIKSRVKAIESLCTIASKEWTNGEARKASRAG